MLYTLGVGGRKAAVLYTLLTSALCLFDKVHDKWVSRARRACSCRISVLLWCCSTVSVNKALLFESTCQNRFAASDSDIMLCRSARI